MALFGGFFSADVMLCLQGVWVFLAVLTRTTHRRLEKDIQTSAPFDHAIFSEYPTHQFVPNIPCLNL